MAADARIAVVGGGIAGLVAARDLAHAGAHPIVLESGERLGGRLRSGTVAGVRLDLGAEAFAVRGGAVAELLGELGLADRIVSPAALGSWIVSDRGAAPMPASGLLGVPARPLGPRTVAAVGLPGAMRAGIEPLLPRGVGSDAATLAELVRTRLGRRVLERLVAPVARGVYSADPADLPVPPELSAALERRGSLVGAARAVRRAASPAGGAVAGLRGGMGELVEALERELLSHGAELRTGTSVTGVVPHGRRWKVRTEGSARIVDAVLFASADAYRAARGSAVHDRLPRTVVEVVALVVQDTRLDRAPRGTGALVAGDGAGSRAKALTHVSAKWPERFTGLRPGTHALRLSYGSASAMPATLRLDDEELEARALADASGILGLELRPDSVRGMLRARWDFASPLSSARPGALPPNWELAGDWVSGTGLASVVPGARAAARRLCGGLGNLGRSDQHSNTHPEHSQ